MNSTRAALRGLLLAALCTFAVGVPLHAPAYAEDPLITATELGQDSAALVVDTSTDLLAGCVPIVSSWTPLALNYSPFIKNNSTYYHETGGGIAHLNCPATYKVVARLSDTAPEPWRLRVGPVTPTVVTSRDPQDSSYVDVPYVGPDAPVLRPAGQVTVHVEVYRRLSTGRYAKVYNGCNEWHFVIQPTVPMTVSDPTQQSACAYDAAYLASDTVDGISQAVEPNSAEALAG